MTTIIRCDLSGARATCLEVGCAFDDADGSLAVQGRHLLAATMMQTIDPALRRGCTCVSCVGYPFTADETASILRHVGDREAVLYLLNLIRRDSLYTCAKCGSLMPVFADTDRSLRGTLARGGCPQHG